MRPASWRGALRNVIVTGGSRGIGLGLVRSLSEAGYQVIAVARHSSAELEALGGGVHFRACDLGDVPALQEFAKSLRREFGPVYALVNNAGIGTSGVLANMSDARIEQLIRLNTLSPITLTRHIVRGMLTGGGGRIVNMASIVASTGFSGLSVYSATKASLVGFTRSLARELGPLGITVNAVAPGFIDTAMTQELDATQRETIRRRSALQRLPESDDIASTVGFLLSDQARNITGTVITVDAGATA